ncbi:MAG: DUF4062 domain-containing protein [Chloroflexi bacterium]|nr:DUF4062 domain-containing protein [Chloroflexota bacterium]
MPERIDVFISSTSRDLRKYRDKVKDAVLNAGGFPIAMEEFDATERNALQKCYDEVHKAEIFIGIYAHRYGFAPGPDMICIDQSGVEFMGDGTTSITEWEYRWALERRLPMLLYVVADNDDDGQPLNWPASFVDGEPDRARLAAFKQNLMGSHVVGFFQSPDDLARQVAGALPKILVRFEEDTIQPAGRRDFYRHVNLPANFVARPDLLTALRIVLLDRDDGIALHGMGGIGKSVMARALCEDAQVQAAFPDGILWVSLGQEPREDDLKAKLRAWIETLGGAVGDAAPSIERLKETLASLLAERACLLILDDVWRRRDGDLFRVGGPRCRMLVTTRDAEVAHVLGVPIATVPLMSDREASDLLDHWSDGALREAPAQTRKQIFADTLGRLPLAIRLAGAQLRGRPPADWLKAFDARRLAARRPESVHDSLALTFGLSLDALHDADRALYASLAIFKEDVAVPLVAVRRLWGVLDGLDPTAVDDLIVDLAARALLELVDEAEAGAEADGAGRSIVLHDLLREFVRGELSDPAQAHRALLDAYGGWGRWHAVPDDGYLYAHLVYHLVGAGEVQALRGLFLDDRWLHVRVAADAYRYDGYVADLETAYFDVAEPEAHRQIESSPATFGAYVDLARYALIRTTINSLASNHIRELIVRAAEIGLEGWSAERVLSIAQHVANAGSRAALYGRLLATDCLTTVQRATAIRRGMESAQYVRELHLRIPRHAAFLPFLDGEERRAAVSLLMAHLGVVSEARAACQASALVVLKEEEGRSTLLEQAIAEAFGGKSERVLADALVLLAPHMAEPHHQRTLEAIGRFDNEQYAVRVLEAMLPHLPASLLARAGKSVDALTFAGFRARACAALALRSPADHPLRAQWIASARADVGEEMDWWVSVVALAGLARVVDGADREAALERAYAIVESLKSPRSQGRALGVLVEALVADDREWVRRCLELARTLVIDDEAFADLLARFAGKATSAEDLREIVIDIAGALDYNFARGLLFEAYAPLLDRQLLSDVLSQTYRVRDERAQIEAIATLSRFLPDVERQAVCEQALGMVGNIRDERTRGRALAPLISAVPDVLFDRTLAKAREIGDASAGLKIVIGLIERFGGSVPSAALDIARRIADPGSHVEALAVLSHLISSEERADLVARAAAGGERTVRSMVYLALVEARDAADEVSRDAALHRALTAARRISSPVLRAWSLVDISRIHFNDEAAALAAQMLEQCLVIRNEWTRASALAALSVVLTPAQRQRAIPNIVALKDPWARIWAMASFANRRDADPQQIADLRRFLIGHMNSRRDVKRDSKLQFLSARSIYHAPAFDEETLAALARSVVEICWQWRWL